MISSKLGECVPTTGHLINHTPTPTLDGKTPVELLFEKPPRYDHLSVFGSLCYAQKLPRSTNKFDEQARRCIFVGYPFGKKGWKVFDLKSK